MLTSTLRVLTAALALLSAAPASELPRDTTGLRPHPAVGARHRPPHELTDVCRVPPVVAVPAPVATTAKAASSCTDGSEAAQ
jgi:hypothetical protein